MAIAYSKLTKRNQTTVPVEILQRLRVDPGSFVEWYEEDRQIFIRRKDVGSSPKKARPETGEQDEPGRH